MLGTEDGDGGVEFSEGAAGEVEFGRVVEGELVEGGEAEAGVGAGDAGKMLVR